MKISIDNTDKILTVGQPFTLPRIKTTHPKLLISDPIGCDIYICVDGKPVNTSPLMHNSRFTHDIPALIYTKQAVPVAIKKNADFTINCTYAVVPYVKGLHNKVCIYTDIRVNLSMKLNTYSVCSMHADGDFSDQNIESYIENKIKTSVEKIFSHYIAQVAANTEPTTAINIISSCSAEITRPLKHAIENLIGFCQVTSLYTSAQVTNADEVLNAINSVNREIRNILTTNRLPDSLLPLLTTYVELNNEKGLSGFAKELNTLLNIYTPMQILAAFEGLSLPPPDPDTDF